MEDPNRKVPDLYFKVLGSKLQVVDLKAEVWELRSGGIPLNLTPECGVACRARVLVVNVIFVHAS